jgi:DoxX-like family
MNKRNIGYWGATGLLCLVYAGSGVADLAGASRVMATVAHLGYPAYLPTLLGVAKLLAVATLLSPGRARLKEWAYAGVAIDLSGALFSHLNVGDGAQFLAPPLVLFALGAASWALRPASRRLAAPSRAPATGDREISSPSLADDPGATAARA